MRIQITARHCNVPDTLLRRTEEQIQKLSRYDPRVGSAEVTYTEEKRSRKAEVVLHIHGAEPVVAHAEEREFRSALDKAIDRITRMLKRERQQHRDHWAPPLPVGTREPEPS
ncbi:MAG: ribosome-associated translation inhibitor RaiA [Gemmatimonadetes bacterium]|nr:ribosome-associated translation inhibitor RaiA [Gemmatimonadota bacterium]